jgi:uncharacterized caspase-like protein
VAQATSAPATATGNQPGSTIAGTQTPLQAASAVDKPQEAPGTSQAAVTPIGPQGQTAAALTPDKGSAPASLERRVALVIGNGKYVEVPLRNPTNDAEDLSKLLKLFRFRVITKTNVNHREMEDAIIEFHQLMRDADVALFYYSGHGTQVQGENYLIPVGENIQSESDVRFKAVHGGHVVAKMEEAKTQINIIILDACRNNPFKGLRSLNRGLTMMQAPQGTFIAYATAPNSVAQDGTGRNGMYTKHLLQQMQVKGAPIEQVFKRVLAAVQNETAGEQIPWVATSLKGDFYFNP